TLADSTGGVVDTVYYTTGHDFDGLGTGPVGGGVLANVYTPLVTTVDPASGFTAGSTTTTRLSAVYQPGRNANYRRLGYPDDLSIVFDDVVRDTSVVLFPNQAKPAKFRILAHESGGTDRQLDFVFRDLNNSQTLDRPDEYIQVLTYNALPFSQSDITWKIQPDTVGTIPKLGDQYELKLRRPLSSDDQYTFTTTSQRVDNALARATKLAPYVVPNPYVGA